MKTLKYDGRDLSLIHINEGKGRNLFLSFSAWSPQGREQPFGLKFFEKNNLEACFISHKKSSIWWHTKEIFDISEILKSHNLKPIILYGSSMGGYAAIHYRNLFRSKLSIAIAPQIFISRSYMPSETRWASDLESIQKTLIFNEIENITQQRSRCIAFFDPRHKLDSDHFKKLSDLTIKTSTAIETIEVPYSNHDVARSLTKSGVLQELLLEVGRHEKIDTQDLRKKCSMVFMSDDKSFLNFYRSSSSLKENEESNLNKFSGIIKHIRSMDFEAQYMAAEVLFKLGRTTEAKELIDLSIESYSTKFKKSPPNYLLLKRDAFSAN